MPVHSSLGVSFQYPENWIVSDEETEFFPRSVSLQSPQGALWSLTAYKTPVAQESILQEALEVLKEEYEHVEAGPGSEEVQGTTLSGYNCDFLCLDFVVQCHIRYFRQGDFTLLALYQAEDRVFDELLPVFRAMCASVLIGA